MLTLCSLVLLQLALHGFLGGFGREVGKSDHLHKGGVDDFFGGVGLEFDEVDFGGAAEDGLQLAHNFCEVGARFEFLLGLNAFPTCRTKVC